MEPERRNDIIKTVLFAAAFILLALFLLDMMIGDPSQIPKPADL